MIYGEEVILYMNSPIFLDGLILIAVLEISSLIIRWLKFAT